MFGCNGKKLNLYEAGIEVTSTIGILVKDDVYVDLIVGSSKTEIDYFVASDYDTPIKTYLISKHNIDKVVEMLEEDMEGLSEEAKNQMLIRADNFSAILDSVRTSISGSADLVWISMSFQCNKVYEGYSLDEECAYLYVFETGKPIVVHFKEINGSVYANGFFFLNDTTLSGLRDVFEPFGSTVEIIEK